MLEEIRNGKFPLGSKLPSQAELVAKYEVSVNTIRQSLLSLEKRGIIRKEQGKGSFVSLQANQSRGKKALRNVGLVFERTYHPEDVQAESQFLLAISDVCREQCIRLVVVETEFDSHLGGEKLIESFDGMPLDGVCLYLHEADGAAERISSLQNEFGAAVVVFPGTTNLPMPMDCIDVELCQGVSHMMKYLLALGHRRIGYVGPFVTECLAGDQQLTSGRIQTYLKAMKDAGINVDRSIAIETPVSSEPSPANYEKILDIVRGDNPVTAIFAANDWMARNLLHCFWKAGVKVPDDVSLVGFDDLPYARELVPSLTTVAFPFEQIAKTSIQLLKHRIYGERQSLKKVTLAAELKIRESVIVSKDD